MVEERIELTELEITDSEDVREDAEEASVEEALAEEASVEEALVDDASVEEALVDDASVEEALVDDASAEEALAEEALVEEALAEEASVEEALVDDASVEEALAEEALIEEVLVEEALVEEALAEEALIEEVLVEEPLVEEASAEEALVEEALIEDASVEEALIEEVLVEEPSAEEASTVVTPLKPEDVARQLFASYLEPAEDESEPSQGELEPEEDKEVEQPDVLEGVELTHLAGAEDESESDKEDSEEDVSEGGRNWFVIHSYSGYENKVKKNLEHRIESLAMQNKIFEVVVPTEEEIELKDGQRRTVERRIFPGYILVDMIMDEDSWYVVRNTPGVTGFVGSVRKPTPLRQRDVDRILKRMRAETPRVKVTFLHGQKVRICDGPFEDFVGAVDEIWADKGKVRILVSFFGRETPVELDFLQVEKI